MKAMVDDLLDFTQTALGVTLAIRPSRCNLQDVATGIVAELRAANPDSGVVLTCEGDHAGNWDPQRLGQMLSNLIANAIQHGELGKDVTVHLQQAEGSTALTVRNLGPALSADAARTLFSPLQQSSGPSIDRHGGSSGLGLGLYISREIAVAHGGTIDVSSDEGVITVRVQLPRDCSTPALPDHEGHAPLTRRPEKTVAAAVVGGQFELWSFKLCARAAPGPALDAAQRARLAMSQNAGRRI